MKKVGRIVFVSLCVSMFVQAVSTLEKKKTAGPIETGEIPSDAPEREKVDGAHCRAIGSNRHVACTAA